jgi:hypothetical protein
MAAYKGNKDEKLALSRRGFTTPKHAWELADCLHKVQVELVTRERFGGGMGDPQLILARLEPILNVAMTDFKFALERLKCDEEYKVKYMSCNKELLKYILRLEQAATRILNTGTGKHDRDPKENKAREVVHATTVTPTATPAAAPKKKVNPTTTTTTTTTDDKAKLPCRFWAAGPCKHGFSCRHKHDTDLRRPGSCFYCNEDDHYARDCPTKIAAKKAETTEPPKNEPKKGKDGGKKGGGKGAG